MQGSGIANAAAPRVERGTLEAGHLIRRASAKVLGAHDRIESLLRRLAWRNPEAFERLRNALLTLELQRAIAAADADMGNIQVVDPQSGRLRITAQMGFESRFLSFFQ
jgi:hypothetical protein